MLVTYIVGPRDQIFDFLPILPHLLSVLLREACEALLVTAGRSHSGEDGLILGQWRQQVLEIWAQVSTGRG